MVGVIDGFRWSLLRGSVQLYFPAIMISIAVVVADARDRHHLFPLHRETLCRCDLIFHERLRHQNRKPRQKLPPPPRRAGALRGPARCDRAQDQGHHQAETEIAESENGGFLGGEGHLFRHPTRRRGGDHRAQRCWKIDVAQAPEPHYRANDRAHPHPGHGGEFAGGRHRLPSRAHRAGEHLFERRDPRHAA